MKLSQLLLPLISALLLSTLGTPWLGLVRRGKLDPKSTFRDRWVLFAWIHPFWAAAMRWVSMVGLVLVTAAALWRWGMAG